MNKCVCHAIQYLNKKAKLTYIILSLVDLFLLI